MVTAITNGFSRLVSRVRHLVTWVPERGTRVWVEKRCPARKISANFERGALARRTTALVLLMAASATPGYAQHRARLSADLADHLASGSQSIDVIVHGDAAQVAAVAARYNLVVARRMKSGAVLRVNAGQLDALQKDADVDHLSGDLAIRSSMATTNVAIGADQV